MAKANKQTFSCQTCGTVYPKWTGQCTGCDGWNTIAEEAAAAATPSRYQGYAGTEAVITCMADVTSQEEMRVTSAMQVT